ncbi:sigma-70 family RNA polymerase sigma factor [Demequina sp.]|uniref:sigma-70 family RNA polymerase sigma factor n=1 Tax=Demequina sp. TaxID=2050685 RepID=UPI003D0AE9EA
MARWEPVLDEVMRERAPRLLAYAALLTGDDAEAQDVLQDALVRSFSRGRAFDNANLAEAYVRRTIPSVFIDRLRKRKAAERAHDRDVAIGGRHVLTTDRDVVMDVRAALAALPPQERACVVLRFYDDLTVPQISAQLGVAEGTVKRYLSDASGKLARILGEEVDASTEAEGVPVVTPEMKGAKP